MSYKSRTPYTGIPWLINNFNPQKKLEFLLSIMLWVEAFDAPVKWNLGRLILRGQLSLFPCSFFIRLVPQHNSILETLKHYYITKRICELLIGNPRFFLA